MTNCTAHLNPVIQQQRLVLPPSLQYKVAAHWSFLCASRPKPTIVMEEEHSKLKLPINKLSKQMSFWLMVNMAFFTWQLLSCDTTNQTAVFILVRCVGVWAKHLPEAFYYFHSNRRKSITVPCLDYGWGCTPSWTSNLQFLLKMPFMYHFW